MIIFFFLITGKHNIKKLYLLLKMQFLNEINNKIILFFLVSVKFSFKNETFEIN